MEKSQNKFQSSLHLTFIREIDFFSLGGHFLSQRSHFFSLDGSFLSQSRHFFSLDGRFLSQSSTPGIFLIKLVIILLRYEYCIFDIPEKMRNSILSSLLPKNYTQFIVNFAAE